MSILLALESSLAEVDKLRKSLKQGSSSQVYSPDERSFAKATALSWFNKHRGIVVSPLGDSKLVDIDNAYNILLLYSEKWTTRKKYDRLLKELHESLLDLRTKNIVTLTNADNIASSEKAPDFSTLISDSEMQAILTRRWHECSTCVATDAPLAATVMMGGLLEALLLARINQLSDKSNVFTATSSPKDKSGKTLPLNEWTLKNYIDVAHDLDWITQTTRDLGNVLRDYRNYIHPYKERSHGIHLKPNDAKMLWELSKSISKQLLTIQTP